MKALHRRTLGAATALLMAASLAACNDDAPGAAAPSSNPGGNSSAPASSAAPSSDAPTPSSDTPSSEPSSDTPSSDTPSSETSTGGGDSGAGCTSSSGQDASKAVAGKTQMTKWGQSLSRTDDSGRKVTIKVDKPTTKQPGDADQYTFDRGQVGGLIPVTIDFDPGDASYKKDYMSYIEFSLRDTSGHPCGWASISKLAGDDNPIMDGVYVTDQDKQAKGTLIFKVPEGADLSKYTLTWTGDTGSATAQFGWTS